MEKFWNSPSVNARSESTSRKWAFCRSDLGRLTVMPTTGPHVLYRGQTRRHTPCFPTTYRHLRRPASFLHQLTVDEAMRIVADVARTFIFYSELDRHPVIRWANRRRLDVSELEIAQHYGLPCSLLDPRLQHRNSMKKIDVVLRVRALGRHYDQSTALLRQP